MVTQCRIEIAIPHMRKVSLLPSIHGTRFLIYANLKGLRRLEISPIGKAEIHWQISEVFGENEERALQLIDIYFPYKFLTSPHHPNIRRSSTGAKRAVRISKNFTDGNRWRSLPSNQTTPSTFHRTERFLRTGILPAHQESQSTSDSTTEKTLKDSFTAPPVPVH
ncbi:hypothetical protein CEXT_585621 [Caerostris extrusa]|uniref:Uncharacterized protein n=1 Tax=Caerostris extrusa TaxID=172846 RepID=A0AAV4XJZ9_CAEEX|nr:hypothetical protein CEXT_585621 [Caerostris extrusa]